MRPGFLWLAGIRDLQWRRRRFVIAVLGTSLVFALTLLLTGFLATFDREVKNTLGIIRADGFMVAQGRPGPFTGSSPIPGSTLEVVRKLPGVFEAGPIIAALQVTDQIEKPDVYIIGATRDGMGSPRPVEGRTVREPGEAVVDKSSTMKLGDDFRVGGDSFKVVGLTKSLTVLGGHPAVFMLIEDAQKVFFGGQPFVMSIAVQGEPKAVPPGISYVSSRLSGEDLRRPLHDTVESIGLFRLMLWIVAAAIIGSVVYLSALERVGDFAVFKATGTATSDLLGALIVQAIALSVSASVLAIGVAFLLAPLFPVEVLFPARHPGDASRRRSRHWHPRQRSGPAARRDRRSRTRLRRPLRWISS